MAVSYNKLWKLLVDKKMSKSDLRKKAEIAPNTMTKLRRDEEVSLTILSKICKTLHADFGDIVEYVPDAEIWDLYNENRELLGKEHVRGEQLPIDGYHLVVHVWIRNSKGEYLISQRSANRPTYPLMWECVGGSVVKGEDSLLGAIREAKEEVGVDLMPENGQVLFTKTRKIIEGKIFNDIMDVWLFEYDGEVDLGNATTDEVAQVAWMNREQIKELFDANMFVDTLEYYDKVGSLYHGDFISGRAAGSFFHWIIRTIYFIVMWAITYGVIWTGKFVMAHKIQVAIGICSIVAVAIAVKIFIWIKERNKLVKVSVKVENNDNW